MTKNVEARQPGQNKFWVQVITGFFVRDLKQYHSTNVLTKPAITPDQEPDLIQLIPKPYSLKILFNIILPSTSMYSECSLPFRFFNQIV